MRRVRKICRISAFALLVVGVTAAASFGQLQKQPELLRRLWPFGRQQQPVPLLAKQPLEPAPQPVKAAKRERRLIAPFVATKIDINLCTLEQLQNLPGVGPALGAHIMAGRPYRDFEDLERDGVPLNVVQGLRSKVTFRQ